MALKEKYPSQLTVLKLDVTDERTAEVLFNMLLSGREIAIDGYCVCVYIHRENESNVYLGSKVGL